MNFKLLDKIQTPANWISDTLNMDVHNNRIKFRSKTFAVACTFIMFSLLTISVSAAILMNFKGWLSKQFEYDVDITEFVGYELTDAGFLKYGNTISYFDGKSHTYLELCSLEGLKSYKGEKHDFLFKYAIFDGKLYVHEKSENILKVTPFNNEYAIIWLDLGDLWNSYYVRYSDGKLKPIVSENISSEQEGIRKLSIEVEVSDDQNYLLYRSDKFTCGEPYKKGEWFIQEVSTGIETKIERAPEELFVDEIGFIDDTHIVISGNEDGNTLIYDCQTKKYIDLGKINGSEFSDTLIFEKGYNNGNYYFEDLYKGKTYKIPSEDLNNTVIVTREFICLLSSDGNADIFFIEENETIHFKTEFLTDYTEINDIKLISENTYAFITDDNVYIATIKK